MVRVRVLISGLRAVLISIRGSYRILLLLIAMQVVVMTTILVIALLALRRKLLILLARDRMKLLQKHVGAIAWYKMLELTDGC